MKMKVLFSILSVILFASVLYGQPNCNWYKYQGDTKKYEACIAAQKRAGHYQFSKEYQTALDHAIAIDSTWAYAYRAKSTAYLKSGDFIHWKSLMDKAVRYAPIEHLGYRGWCRYQFFWDYRGAILDIESLDSLTEHDIGYSVNGDYHLHIARALCYKAIGQPQKAINIIENQLQDSSYYPGLFDYLHLGVLYLEMGKYHQAIECLEKQMMENDLAENRYYMALAYQEIGEIEESRESLKIALINYKNKMRMFDPYTEPMDKIYLVNIQEQLKKTESPGIDDIFGQSKNKLNLDSYKKE